jgi:hypothetical protein
VEVEQSIAVMVSLVVGGREDYEVCMSNRNTDSFMLTPIELGVEVVVNEYLGCLPFQTAC